MRKFFFNALAFLLPLSAGAIVNPKAPKIDYGDSKIETDSFGDLNSLFEQYIKYFINLFWVITVLFGIYAAFKFLTAKGDPKAADSAKQMVKYTVIAACVALLATVIKEIAKSLLKVSA